MELSVTRVEVTGSTNADLLAAARRGAASGTVLVAGRQDAGRGRLGRTWEAPAGSSLLMSVLVRPQLAADRLHVLTQWMALAAADACEEVTGVRPDLKWPNDLLVGDRKLAGILAEVAADGGRVDAVVVGMGLNVNWSEPLPDHLAEVAVALNQVVGRPVDLEAMLAAVLHHLGQTELSEVPERYRARLATVGRRVRVELAGTTIEGVATDVADDGRLTVRTDDGAHTVVSAGDVVHLRPAADPSC